MGEGICYVRDFSSFDSPICSHP